MAFSLTMDATDRQPAACRECPPAQCALSVMAVRAYLYAYRDARRHGDDPAEYIRDCVRPSRMTAIDAVGRGARRDPLASLDIKLSLERARDVGGLSLEPWNAERVASYLCSRATEAVTG